MLLTQPLSHQILQVLAPIERVILLDIVDIRLLFVRFAPVAVIDAPKFGSAVGTADGRVPFPGPHAPLVVDRGDERCLRREGVGGRRCVPEQHRTIISIFYEDAQG